MLAFGLYLQHVVGLEPCPMCIVQRYALVLVAVFAAWRPPTARGLQATGAALVLLVAGFGAFVAARQAGCSGTRRNSAPAAATSTE